MSDLDTKRKQIELAEKLQLMLLQDFNEQLTNKTLTPTDRATLARLLMQNGWSIDPALLPKGLRGVLTDKVDASVISEDDADVPWGH
jgi:hypothetical protein